jgi:thioredoxin-related protein
MDNTYKDRGIIKWAPFDALSGYQGLLNTLKYRLGQKEKPTLSDDDYEQLNKDLLQALEKQTFVTIYYFKKGYIHYISGYMTKADFIFKCIVVNRQTKLLAHDIIAIEIADTYSS